VALPALVDALKPLPVMGVIFPGAQAALAAAPEGPIAVLATETTVKGGAYVRAIQAHSQVPVVQQACPLFVPMTEEGLISGPIVDAIIHRYLDPILATVPHPRCMLLGCTHYPVLRTALEKAVGSGITLVDSATTTAQAVSKLLNELSLNRTEATKPTHLFLATDAPDRFARVGEIFLGNPIDPGQVELIDLS
jgi:glutamate racemase